MHTPIAFGTAQHWRERAQEARTMAAGIQDPDARDAMLAVAENYEKVAMRAEAREAGVTLVPHKGSSDSAPVRKSSPNAWTK